uniref:Uncharacterized protein n=1 Tax=Globisporangium ultimum (strain ATCC 200006 / CBS 805.95 / DAOM BR144) TaxID=431595 RepID=K3W4Y8_GLOUD
LNRSKTIERESDDRQSPFGKIIVQTPTAYQYLATKTEEDEMEHIRWEVQHTVFQRYYDLTQREPQWGSIDVRDGELPTEMYPGTSLDMLSSLQFIASSL